MSPTSLPPRSGGVSSRLLLLGALVAWAACMIACRPAWSPDGQTLLFSYPIESKGAVAVGLFDRRTSKATELTRYVFSDAKDPVPVSTVWTEDGSSIVCLVPAFEGKDHLRIDVFDAASGKRLRRIELREHREPLIPLISRPPIVDNRYLLLGARKGLARVDIQTGEVVRGEGPLKNREVFTFGRRGRAYYATKREDQKDNPLELGSIDAKTVVGVPFDRVRELNAPEVGVFFGTSQDGKVVIAIGVHKGKPSLLFFEKGRLEKSIPLVPPKVDPDIGLANVDLSSKGDFVYSSYMRRRDRGVEYGLASIAVKDGTLRFHPLFEISEGKERDAGLFLFQTELSPDGKVAAMSSTMFSMEGIQDEDRALFLVDVSEKDWKTTRVSPPAP